MNTACSDWALVPPSDLSCELWEGDDMARCVDVYTTVAGTYAPVSTDCVIFCDASGGAVTINLPDGSLYGGKLYTFVKIDSSINGVTIDGYSTQTINGSSTYPLAAQYDRVRMICNGTNWIILGT